MPPVLLGYLVVFFGGGCGAAIRHGINRLSLTLSPDFPAGTMVINILGCFVMGVFTAWFAFKGEATSQHMRLLLTTGLLGGFTTFSAFSLDAAYLWQRGQVGAAAFYVLGSVGLSLVAVFAGMAITRQFFA
jgi:fluoride exporter